MRNSQRNQFLKYFNYLWKHLFNWKIFWGKMLCMLLTCQGSEDHICWYLRYFICIYIMFKKLKYPLKFVRFYIFWASQQTHFFWKFYWCHQTEILSKLSHLEEFKLDFPQNSNWISHSTPAKFPSTSNFPALHQSLEFLELCCFLFYIWQQLEWHFSFLPNKDHIFACDENPSFQREQVSIPFRFWNYWQNFRDWRGRWRKSGGLIFPK